MEIGFWVEQPLDETMLYTYRSVPISYISTPWRMPYIFTPLMIRSLTVPLMRSSVPTPMMMHSVSSPRRIRSASNRSQRRHHRYEVPPRMRSQHTNNTRIHSPNTEINETVLDQQHYLVGSGLSQHCISDFLVNSLGFLTLTQENIICTICQDEINAEEETVTLNCRHVYHAGCIEKWLMIKNECPVCRASVIPREDFGRALY